MNEPDDSSLSKFIAQFLTIGFLLFLVLFGAFICGVGLKEPDTCFLLAMGRWIVEHGTLPYTDPFSYTYAIVPNGGPFVVYQWLSEVIFYLVVNAVGGVGLIAVMAICFAFAFVIMPLKIMRHCGADMCSSIGIAILTAMTSWTHINARPEILSYLLLAQWCYWLLKSDDKHRLSIPLLLSLVCTMILWCNLHTGFVTGLLLLLVWCIGSIFESALDPKRHFNRTCLVALPLCLASTLLNPKSHELWLYLPYLFFHPLNATINELKAVSFDWLKNPFSYPYFILVLIFASQSVQLFRQHVRRSFPAKYLMIGLIAVSSGFAAYRFMNFAAILLVLAIGGVYRQLERKEKEKYKIQAGIETELARRLSPEQAPQRLLYVLVVLGGAFLITAAVPPAVPQSSKAFHPPLAAINYLTQHPQSGNMLNDPHYGDVMMWQMKNCPPLFLDSRYDIYNASLVNDYWAMVNLSPGYLSLMRKFNITWIFLPTDTKLVKKLSNSPDWCVVYNDQYSTICAQR